MDYTEIAGRRVSAMSLGTVQLGMNYGIANREGKPARAKRFAMLKAALDNGVSALDTARAYGDSEETLGAFLRAFPEAGDTLFITTKLSSGLPPGSSPGAVEKALAASAETSLTALGLSKVQCLLLHNPHDLRYHGPAVADALRSLLAQGLADLAGVSIYHPEEADLLLLDDVYQAVQLPLSILDQRFLQSGALERLARAGVRVFARSVFFQGLLFLDPDTLEDPDLARFAGPPLKALRRLSEKAGMSRAQLAASFVRGIPGIASLVLGADNPKQVQENARLFDAPVLGEETRQAAEAAFQKVDYPGIMAVLSRPKE